MARMASVQDERSGNEKKKRICTMKEFFLIRTSVAFPLLHSRFVPMGGTKEPIRTLHKIR